MPGYLFILVARLSKYSYQKKRKTEKQKASEAMPKKTKIANIRRKAAKKKRKRQAKQCRKNQSTNAPASRNAQDRQNRARRDSGSYTTAAIMVILGIYGCWSGIPDSNWRPSAWQADALSTELIPHLVDTYFNIKSLIFEDSILK